MSFLGFFSIFPSYLEATSDEFSDEPTDELTQEQLEEETEPPSDGQLENYPDALSEEQREDYRKTKKYNKIAQLLIKEYSKEETAQLFKALVHEARQQFEELLEENNIKAIVTCRCKKPKSLEKKMHDGDERKNFTEFLGPFESHGPADKSLVRKLYEHADMSDLAGVRIGVYLPGDIPKVGEMIDGAFKVLHTFGTVRDTSRIPYLQRNEKIERHKDGPWVQESGRGRTTWEHYGYKSWQSVVEWSFLDKKLHRIASANTFYPLRVEIQLGTVMTQAWAEVQHDIIYKAPPNIQVTDTMRQMIDATNGMTITADILLGELERSRKQAEDEVETFFNQLWDGCRRGDPRVTKQISSTTVNLGTKDDEGNTALHFACEQGSFDIVESLLAVLDKPVVSLTNKSGQTALHFACKGSNNSKIVERLLAVLDKSDVSLQDHDGETALHLACMGSNVNLRIVKKLLSVFDKTDVCRPNHKGRTALHIAAGTNGTYLVSALLPSLDSDAVCAQDYWQDTALHLACKEGHGGVVKELIARVGREKLKVKGQHGLTAFRVALTSGQERAVGEFAGFLDEDDLLATDWLQQTALHVAATSNLVSVVEEFLIKAKGGIDMQDTQGDTALHKACMARNEKIVRTLLRANATVSIQNRFRTTAFEVAEKHDFEDIVKLFQEQERRQLWQPWLLLPSYFRS